MSDGLDVSRLSPGDAVAALRSYPRRFRGLLTSLDEDERSDDLVHRAGPDGLSAVDHADHAARSMAILGEALRQVLVQDEPTLLPAVADDSARAWQMAAQVTPNPVLNIGGSDIIPMWTTEALSKRRR